jgi:small-conductance mechanosensitive channel
VISKNARDAKLSLKREWAKGIVASAVALTALGLGKAFGKITNSSTNEKLIGWAAALVLLIAGTYAIRHLARALGRGLARRSSIGAGATLRLVVTGVGAVILLFALFAVLGVSLQHLLIGAGLAGVILGIAAQQSLSNIFASVVLLFARPFHVGEDIRIRSGVVGVIDVTVMGIGLTYVTVRTDDGVLKIPNSVMLGSAIGRPHPASPAPTATTPVVSPTSNNER